MRRRTEFASVRRHGRGVRVQPLVLALGTGPEAPPRVGFVVPRAVGRAVVRNRVRRRLRHLSAARLDRLPSGAMLVVRVLPGAGGATFAELGAALDRGLGRLLAPAPGGGRS
jgi:ribonuclease P protein component